MSTSNSKVWVVPGLFDLDDILADVWGIQKEKIFSPSRKREVADARMTGMFFRTKAGATSRAVGAIYGRDYSTVINAVKVVRNLLETDKGFRAKVEEVKNRMEQRNKLFDENPKQNK